MRQSRSIRHASKIGRYAWNMAMASRLALIASALRGLPVRGSNCTTASSSASSLATVLRNCAAFRRPMTETKAVRQILMRTPSALGGGASGDDSGIPGMGGVKPCRNLAKLRCNRAKGQGFHNLRSLYPRIGCI